LNFKSFNYVNLFLNFLKICHFCPKLIIKILLLSIATLLFCTFNILIIAEIMHFFVKIAFWSEIFLIDNCFFLEA